MEYKDKKHRIAFITAVRKKDKNDYTLMSAIYLLSADFKLWQSVKRYVEVNNICFEKIQLNSIDENGYALFCAAKDLYLGTKHLSVGELADTDLIVPKVFKLISNAMAIKRCGLSAIHFTVELIGEIQNGNFKRNY